MDDEYTDDYYDTISVNSSVPNRKSVSYGRNPFNRSQSQNTVYYSLMNLDGGEMMEMNGRWDDKNKEATTYEKWRNLKWNSFSTGESVDYVLAYEDISKPGHAHFEDKRKMFEFNLQQAGLLLERDETQTIHFVKIHAPKSVLCQYAELLKLRLPIKLNDQERVTNILVKTLNKILDYCSLKVDKSIFPSERYKLTFEYSRDKDYLFDSNSPDFFKTSTRIMIIDYILEREKYGDDLNSNGIKKLLSEGVYKAAYPLHDGDLNRENSKRKLLLDHWASVSQWIKYQPIDEIKEYFGVKFALYFTWLGFYTHMLIPAAIVGLLCFLFGIFSLHKDVVVDDMCNMDIVMCPRCDKYCDYWKLSESCTYAKIQHFIDNPATIFFAVFMSFWATLYMELWKRYSAGITHRWGLTGFDLLAEPPRPEYLMRLANVKKRKLNVVTLVEEPAVSYWKVKLPSMIFSFSIVLLWILLTLAVVFGIIIYRMSLMTSEVIYSYSIKYTIYTVPVIAAVLNLICIQLLSFLYDKLAHKLTEMEIHRTQTEYDDSHTLKSYLFQFVNYYSSIFYIAFLKGKFVGYPAKYNRIFGYRQEECNPGGCLMELSIQLGIIMIGNQALNSFLEMTIPLAIKMYKTFKVSTGIERAEKEKQQVIICCNQWTEDYKLNEFNESCLFQEYLEMVLQYGFVTIFVTAFPLAPLFALVNNVFEMRLDAKKFIKYYRRPVPTRVKNIGVWYQIMTTIGRLSVISNAFILAFSSNFIPKLVYILKVSENHTEDGFLNHSLAVFDVRDFENGTAPEKSVFSNITTCRYPEYRSGPYDDPKYKRPLVYWQVMVARLAFIVAYQNLVSFVIMAVEWAIPDVPRRLNDQIKKEAYRTNEMILQYEAQQAKEKVRRRYRDGPSNSQESLGNESRKNTSTRSSGVFYDAVA
ncbi:anoctamin-1 isoform X1 [Coccinella septempunctata]|uniref:anoctamin-1 isoform X1 n=1 Tax=Coccinella septempunctata TaxID=41139 RepID=UPI001D064C0C|nr:anoctamin-1 isoform X1 [Coccinella septempunctata]XP_044748114.1 anoctamin-1 isoform X1 [Coccinella septempunctata]XP_044748115.1 anoctamin-1 isoform X1 [Coccinella septempunctata]